MTARHQACPVCRARGCESFARVDGRVYWRCPVCECTFLSPSQRPDRAREIQEYRLHRNRIDDPGYRRFLQRLADPLLARIATNAEGLDYGCGPGPALASMLAEAGHRVALFDPLFFDDRDALARRYDFVTCSEVAEHFHHPAEEFERLGALLNPGGWLAVMTKFQTDDAAFAGWHYRRDPTHVVFYRETTFRAIADRHGWDCDVPCPDVVLLRKPV